MENEVKLRIHHNGKVTEMTLERTDPLSVHINFELELPEWFDGTKPVDLYISVDVENPNDPFSFFSSLFGGKMNSVSANEPAAPRKVPSDEGPVVNDKRPFYSKRGQMTGWEQFLLFVVFLFCVAGLSAAYFLCSSF